MQPIHRSLFRSVNTFSSAHAASIPLLRQMLFGVSLSFGCLLIFFDFFFGFLLLLSLTKPSLLPNRDATPLVCQSRRLHCGEKQASGTGTPQSVMWIQSQGELECSSRQVELRSFSKIKSKQLIIRTFTFKSRNGHKRYKDTAPSPTPIKYINIMRQINYLLLASHRQQKTRTPS